MEENVVLLSLERFLLGFGHIANGLVGRDRPRLSGPHQNGDIARTCSDKQGTQSKQPFCLHGPGLRFKVRIEVRLMVVSSEG